MYWDWSIICKNTGHSFSLHIEILKLDPCIIASNGSRMYLRYTCSLSKYHIIIISYHIYLHERSCVFVLRLNKCSYHSSTVVLPCSTTPALNFWAVKAVKIYCEIWRHFFLIVCFYVMWILECPHVKKSLMYSWMIKMILIDAFFNWKTEFSVPLSTSQTNGVKIYIIFLLNRFILSFIFTPSCLDESHASITCRHIPSVFKITV